MLNLINNIKIIIFNLKTVLPITTQLFFLNYLNMFKFNLISPGFFIKFRGFVLSKLLLIFDLFPLNNKNYFKNKDIFFFIMLRSI